MHKFKPDSGWTIRDNATSEFVAVIHFYGSKYVEGVGTQRAVVDCVAIEAHNAADCINRAIDYCRNDPRESTFAAYRTWIIPRGLPHAGKRDNARIN